MIVDFADSDSSGDAEPDGTWRRRRIDVGIQMPKGLDLVVRTGSGKIEVEGVKGSMELFTDTGDVVAKVETGGFDAKSRRGSIRTKVMSTESDEPILLQSVNGSVRVLLLEGASARVTVESSHLISTDYSVEIDREPGKRLKKGRAVIGEGRRTIHLSTVNGQARLSNLIAPERPRPD